MSILTAARGYNDVTTAFRDAAALDMTDEKASRDRLDELRLASIQRQMPAKTNPLPIQAAQAPAVDPRTTMPGQGRPATGKPTEYVSSPDQLPNEMAKFLRQGSTPSAAPAAPAKSRAPLWSGEDEIAQQKFDPGQRRAPIGRAPSASAPAAAPRTFDQAKFDSLMAQNNTRTPVKTPQAQYDARLAAQQVPSAGGAANQYDKPTQYDPIIGQAAQQAGIDPVLFKRLLGSESSFNPNAVSPRGESYGYGIAQIAASHGLSREQMANPAVAIPFAANLLAKYIAASGGDVREGVMKYKGAVSEQGRAAMGQVYDQKIAGGAAQQGQPQAAQAAPGQPQQAAQPGGYSPAEMAQMLAQQAQQIDAQQNHIQQVANATRDPAVIAQLREKYIQLDEARYDMQLQNAVREGRLPVAQYQELSKSMRAMQAKRAEEAYLQHLKTQGKIQEIGAQHAGEMNLQELRGNQALTRELQTTLAAAQAKGYHITASSMGGYMASGPGGVFNIDDNGKATRVDMTSTAGYELP